MEKKRRRPNWIDIALIVLIAAVALAAFLISRGEEQSVTIETVKRSYTIELSGLDPYAVDCVNVGDSVTDKVRNIPIGTVTAVETVPYTSAVTDKENLVIRQVEVPDKINLIVTVEADTTETSQQIATSSGYPIKVGSSVSCTVGTLRATGFIIEVER